MEISNKKNNGNKGRNFGEALLFGIAILILSGSFLRLGFWQLDRAQDLKRVQSIKPNVTVVDLLNMAQPGSNLSGESVNRIVRFSGRYVAHYVAPDQGNNRETWIVDLMEIPDIGAILVARAIEGSTRSEMPRDDIDVVGKLMPRQFEDRSFEPTPGSLVRIDSSLIVEDTDLALFDGFVIAQSEKLASTGVSLDPGKRIEATSAKPTVPGFYWQHIAYVAIWWIAAVVVLFLPFYQRVRKREIEERS